MNFVSRRGLIVGTILLLLISDINGVDVSSRKRQINSEGENDLDWQVILNDIRKIPLIGQALGNGIEGLGKTVSKIDGLTNGALSRIAGGYPPCTIDLNGVRCNGKAKDGGIVGISRELISSTVLPDLVKRMLVNLFNASIAPLLDAILGIPVSP